MIDLIDTSCLLSVAPIVGAALASAAPSLLDSVTGSATNGFLSGIGSFANTLTGGVLGKIGGLFGFGGNNSSKEAQRNREFQYKLFRENQDWQAAQAELAYNRQLEYTDKINAYNSPINQRKLLKRAGYNPNLAMSGAAGVAQASGQSAPQASGGSVPSGAMGNPVGDAVMSAQINQINSQSAVNNAQAHFLNSQTKGQDISNDTAQLWYRIYQIKGEKHYDAEINDLLSDASLKGSQTIVQNSIASLNRDELFNMRPRQRDNLIADTVIKQCQPLIMQLQAAKTEKEIDQIVQQMRLSLTLTMAQVNLFGAQASNQRSQSRLNGVMADNWSDGGVLWRQANVSTYGNALTNKFNEFMYKNKRKYFESIGDKFIDAVIDELDIRSSHNGARIRNAWGDSAGTAWMIFDELKSMLPAGNPAPYNSPFSFPNPYGF